MIIRDELIIKILERDDEVQFREWWIGVTNSSNLGSKQDILKILFRERGSITSSTKELMGLIFKREAYKCFGLLVELAGQELMSKSVRYSQCLAYNQHGVLISLPLIDYLMGLDTPDSVEKKRKWIDVAKQFWVRFFKMGTGRGLTEVTDAEADERGLTLAVGIMEEISIRSGVSGDILVLLHATGILDRVSAEKIFKWSEDKDEEFSCLNATLSCNTMSRIEAADLKAKNTNEGRGMNISRAEAL